MGKKKPRGKQPRNVRYATVGNIVFIIRKELKPTSLKNKKAFF